MLQLIILLLAFYWLLIETDYLRVKLPIGELTTIWYEELPYEICYQDYEVMELIEPEWLDDTDIEYQKWIRQKYFIKYSYGYIDTGTDYPQDQWLKEIEGLTKRRRGEMIYQRGKNR